MSIKKHIPNFLTFLNMACGFVSLVMLFEGKFIAGMWWMFFSVIFDATDGKIASMLHVKTETGGAMDMLADVISFGLLPGVGLYLFYQLAPGDSPLLTGAAWVAGIGYAFAGVLRETRFITSQSDRARHEGFVGLGIAPPAGFNVAILSLVNVYPDRLYTPLVLVLVFALATSHAYLMIKSEITFYRWGARGILAQFGVSLIIGILTGIFLKSYGAGLAVFFIGVCTVYIYAHVLAAPFKSKGT